MQTTDDRRQTPDLTRRRGQPAHRSPWGEGGTTDDRHRTTRDANFFQSEIGNRKSEMLSRGQAMVEFMVGLVVVLVLLAGLIQIGQLTHARTRTMIAARAQAGLLAMAPTPPMSETALLISDWVTNTPTNALATLMASLNLAGDFFLVKGEASSNVTILPIIQRLVYAHPTLEVESDAWLVWTEGIY